MVKNQSKHIILSTTAKKQQQQQQTIHFEVGMVILPRQCF